MKTNQALWGGVLVWLLAVMATGPSEAAWERGYRTQLGSRLDNVAFAPEGLTASMADRVVRLDRTGTEIQRQMIDTTTSYVVLAENGCYGVAAHRPEAPTSPKQFALYSTDGLVDSFPISGTPYLAPGGDWILTVDHFKRAVTLYSDHGQMLRTDTYPVFRDFDVQYSNDGERVILNMEVNPMRGRAVAYDRWGRKLRMIEHGLGPANPRLSADGTVIALIGRVAVLVYSEAGVVRASFGRGTGAGPGVLTADGERLWLAEDGGIRVIAVAAGDSHTFTLPAEAGKVVRLSEDPSGKWVLIGQQREDQDSGTVWTWRVYDARTEAEVWSGEERSQFGYAKLGRGIVLKGIDEIEVWEDTPAGE